MIRSERTRALFDNGLKAVADKYRLGSKTFCRSIFIVRPRRSDVGTKGVSIVKEL